ncbi:MAG TPA: cation-transporting P-type ATPase [Patescibacteria group bacterium]
MEQGLSSIQVSSLQQQFGKNSISHHETFSAIKLFLKQFPTIINAILVLAGIFSLLINQPLDASFIFAIIVLDILLGFSQEYRAEKAIQKLKDLSQPQCLVIRDGNIIEILIENLVPGDVVILHEGERLPADGTIKSDSHLEIDESLLTGESLPVSKKQNDPAFRGTYVSKGKGKLFVTTIGNNTRIGQIAKTLISVKEEATPLQKQIVKLARIFTLGAIIISILIIPRGIYSKQSLFPLLLVVVSIAVAAIPESLPAVITIALSLGANKMAQKKAIVRKLTSIETIGAVNVILTDKTGTLTQNNMTVKEIYVPNEGLLHQLIHASIVGNTAHIVEKENQKKIIGDKTDGALLLWATSQKLTEKEQQESNQIIILDEFTFDPQNKVITTVASLHDKPYVIVRGAPETILSFSKITPKEKEKLIEIYQNFAIKGLRVIALAHKIEPKHTGLTRKELETNLTFLGFLALYDPPRPQAKQAVIDAQHAGIAVVMVTGDNPLTAKTIATEVGILDGEKTVLTGEEISKMSNSELQEAIKHVRVFARTTPEHKMMLVELFQSQNAIVGVTGDGINDALALKKADVGISMGRKGTDVAKEASDIVLSDDNFATLIAAVFEGRKIYTNIVNAITYLITGNLSELLVIFFASIFHMATPLLPTQILWINLVTDGLPALALANDKGGKYLLEKTPRKKEQPIITKNRFIFIVIAGIILAGIVVYAFSFIDDHFSLEKARTLAFGLVVILEMILAIIIRGKSLFSNVYFYLTIFITILLQLIITFVPFFQQIFHLSI